MSRSSSAHIALAPIPWGWRCIFALVRGLSWLLGTGLVLLLLFWAVAHFYLAPRINQYQGTIERIASQQLGLTVRIGRMQAQPGPVTHLDIYALKVYDQQGRLALALPQVQVGISPLALLRMAPAYVRLVEPNLVLRREPNGRILVGGLDWGQGEQGSADAMADRFFSLTRFEVRAGRVLWLDEKRQAPPLALQDVDIGIRNAWGRHRFYVAATPPANWGQRLTLQADLQGPSWSAHPGAWRTWQGQIYADLPMANAADLGAYLDTPLQVLRGAGALRSWAEFDRGQIRSVVLDAALARVALRLQPDLPALDLQDLQGRLLLLRQAQGLSALLQDGQFTTAQGLRWPTGSLQLELQGDPAAPSAGVFTAQSLSLPILTQMAQSLPMSATLRQQLGSLQAQGKLEQFKLIWQGDISAPRRFRAQGQVLGLALAAQAVEPEVVEPEATAASIVAGADINSIAVQAGNSPKKSENNPENIATESPSPSPGRPGLAGADIRFDVRENSGHAQLHMRQGWLEFPGVFQEPRLPLDKLDAQLSWSRQGEAISLTIDKAEFANADVQGSAQATWQTSAGTGAARFPGVLDLQGQFSRAQASRVWRYLPLAIPQEARDYVQQAVQGGVGSKGSFAVKGNLLDIPSKDPKASTFRIAAHIDQGHYQYIPKTLLAAGEPAWPALRQISGELLFDGYGMYIQNAQGFLGSMPIAQAQADLPDWDALRVRVQGQLQGDLAQALASVQGTGINALLGQQLAQVQGAGPTQIALQLDLPIHELTAAKVSGQVQLQGNSLRWLPQLPSVQELQGKLQFDEQGFVLQDISGKMLGGAVRLQGGMGALAGRKDDGLHLQAQGQLQSTALRTQSELPWLVQLGQHLQGSAAYQWQLDGQGDKQQFAFSSPMQGMAVNLPAPLGKTAASKQTLHLQLRQLPMAKNSGAMQQVQANWGQDLAAQYEIQEPRANARKAAPVVRGLIGLGALPANARLPDSGVQLLIQAEALDAQQWQQSLNTALAASDTASNMPAWLRPYVPERLALRLGRLDLGDRSLHGVQALIERGSDGLSWKVQGQAQELSGQLEYRPGHAGQAGALNARLKHLNWTEAQSSRLTDNLLHAPSNIPSLDVVVDNFHLRGKPLGRLEIQANNYGTASDSNREWRLNKLDISSPEAIFNSTGVWLPGQGQQGRTVLQFKADLNDAGKLLERLGQKDVLAKGKGSITGQVSWQGAVTNPDYASMNGKLQMQVQNGRFLKADPGAAKLLGVLNLQALPRRLSLDFRDVFAQGFAFDFVRGDVQIDKGLASTNNLQMKGVNAAVLMEGVADLKDETQDLHVLIAPEINAGTAALVATAINPAIGIGAFVAQWLLSKPVNQAATQSLRITGSWADPKVEKLSKAQVAPRK